MGVGRVAGMLTLRALSVGLMCVVLASCATREPSGPPPVLAKLQAMGIDSATYTKIENHRVLTFGDILGLLKKNVPSPVILTYIKSTKAPYTLTNAQLQKLIVAGASGDLVNYLGRSVGFFEATERSQTGGAGKWKNDPFFNDPFYMGEPPFVYVWPGEWYDPMWMNAVF